MAKIQITKGDVKAMVAEAVRRVIKEEMGGQQLCNMMISRFQPVTNEDIQALQAAKQQCGYPTVILTTPGKGDKKHPIAGQVQQEMLERVKAAYPDLIADVIFVKNADIVANVQAVRDHGFEPVTWTCGEDKRKWYGTMVERYAQQLNLRPDFQLIPSDREEGLFAAQSALEALANGDREEFEYDVPECIADMFDVMTQAIGGGQQASGNINEIGDTPQGQYMLGRLAGRKQQQIAQSFNDYENTQDPSERESYEDLYIKQSREKKTY